MRQVACFVSLLLCILIACGDPQAQHSTGTYVPNASAPPSGAAGGDLSGSYPNPTVAQVTGASTPATVGMIRMPKNTGIYARNFNNTADIELLGTDGSSNITIGDTTHPPQTAIEAQGTVVLASNIVGNGGAEIALSSGSFDSPSIEVLPDQTLDATALLVAQNGLQLFSTSTNFGGGTGVLALHNAGVAPTAACGSGGCLYESTGILCHLGSGGALMCPAGSGTGSKNTQSAVEFTQMAFLRTAANTAATIYTSGAFPHVISFRAHVSTIDTVAAASSAAALVACSYYNASGTATQLGSSTTFFNHGYSSAPTCVVSGGTVLIKVTPNTTNTSDSQAVIWTDQN